MQNKAKTNKPNSTVNQKSKKRSSGGVKKLSVGLLLEMWNDEF